MGHGSPFLDESAVTWVMGHWCHGSACKIGRGRSEDRRAEHGAGVLGPPNGFSRICVLTTASSDTLVVLSYFEGTLITLELSDQNELNVD